MMTNTNTNTKKNLTQVLRACLLRARARRTSKKNHSNKKTSRRAAARAAEDKEERAIAPGIVKALTGALIAKDALSDELCTLRCIAHEKDRSHRRALDLAEARLRTAHEEADNAAGARIDADEDYSRLAAELSDARAAMAKLAAQAARRDAAAKHMAFDHFRFTTTDKAEIQIERRAVHVERIEVRKFVDGLFTDLDRHFYNAGALATTIDTARAVWAADDFEVEARKDAEFWIHKNMHHDADSSDSSSSSCSRGRRRSDSSDSSDSSECAGCRSD